MRKSTSEEIEAKKVIVGELIESSEGAIKPSEMLLRANLCLAEALLADSGAEANEWCMLASAWILKYKEACNL